MLGNLALQKEILAAIEDKDALRAIAEREGIDPKLWDCWISMTQIVTDMNAEMEKLLEGVTKSDPTSSKPKS